MNWRKASHSSESGDNCIEVGAVPPSGWRKASKSNESGDNCVEVAGTHRRVALRDSKDPDGGVLEPGLASFRTLVDSIKRTR
ncbi:DUF397 domain-containing protein [Spirillospora sp. NPDC052269]